jgi:hypothetical protein
MLWNADTRCQFKHTLPQPEHYLQALRHPSPGFVTGIAAILARLAEEPGLHERLAAGAWESVRSGHLSVSRRREILAEVYGAATA